MIAEPVAYRFADDGRIPNNPRLPLLVYARAVDPCAADLAVELEQLFARCGWAPVNLPVEAL